MAAPKIYFDYLSQPARAVLLLMQVNKIEYEPRVIRISKGEQTTSEELAKVNPCKQVPAMDDNGFCLFESAAILKYLCGKYKLPDHWYPADLQRQAKIDEYLNWHHSNLRIGAARTLFIKCFQPMFMPGTKPDEERLKETKGILKRSIERFESYFLKDHKFISSDEISIADLQAVCEFTQIWVTGLDPFKGKPRLTQWMADCQSALQPHFDEVHKVIYKIRDDGTFAGTLESLLD